MRLVYISHHIFHPPLTLGVASVTASIVLGGTTIHNSMSFLTDVAQLGAVNSASTRLGSFTIQWMRGSQGARATHIPCLIPTYSREPRSYLEFLNHPIVYLGLFKLIVYFPTGKTLLVDDQGD